MRKAWFSEGLVPGKGVVCGLIVDARKVYVGGSTRLNAYAFDVDLDDARRIIAELTAFVGQEEAS